MSDSLHNQEIGANLRAMRQRYALKQDQLAAALNVQRAAVTRWEQGTRGLTVDMLLRIADRFGIPAGQLLPERHRGHAAPTIATPTGARTPEAAAIMSIAQVLHERPDLILTVMQVLEQETAGVAEERA
ncbi:MAG: helix-turn-helix transcriptional regulator [Blastochloris sp.]|nr:helix-turn-helix transcriptional regulator [Blastochloris sp.]